MAAGDGGDVRFSIGIDTAGAAAEFKKLSELNTSAAKKMVSQWTRELGAVDAATRDVAKAMLKATEQWDARLVVLKRAQVALEQELATTKRIAQEREKIAKGKSSEAYGPALTAQQRRRIEFDNKRREREAAAEREAKAYGPAKPSRAFLEAQRMTQDRLKKEAAAREKVIAALEKASQRLVNLGDVERFDAGAFNARGVLRGDIGAFFGEGYFDVPGGGGGGRRGGGGGGGGGGAGTNRAQRMGRGAYRDPKKRRQAAVQQAIFAADDAIVSFGTGGLAGAIRGASNNITSMASLLGGPLALGFAVVGGAVAQLGIAFWNASDGAEEAAKAEEKLAKSREKSAAAFREIASDLLGAGVSGATTARGAAARRAFDITSGARAEKTRLLGDFTEEYGYRRADDVTLQSAARSLGIDPSTVRSSRQANALLDQYNQSLNPTQRALQKDAIARERAFIRQQEVEAFGLRDAAGVEARGRERRELSGLANLQGNRIGGGLLARLEELGLREDSLFQLFDADRIGLTEYEEALGDLSKAQTELAAEMREFSDDMSVRLGVFNAEQGLAAGFRGSAGGVYAERRQRQEIADFVTGGLLEGLSDAEVRGFATERFGRKDSDPLGEDGILSKATIGANAARAGGDEFSRLLSGEDSGRKLVTINEEQLTEQRKANELLNDQLDNMLEVAN